MSMTQLMARLLEIFGIVNAEAETASMKPKTQDKIIVNLKKIDNESVKKPLPKQGDNK